jgi:release factor glutamine methyltransferase
LIDLSLELASDAKRVLDLGTGSGALLVTALLELDKASGIATDRSGAALEVAQSNARALGLEEDRARFLSRDWTTKGWTEGLGQFDLILSNPPYVEQNAQLEPDVRDFEPHGALFSGSEGLDDYHSLIPRLRELMEPKGIAILEIGSSQSEAVTQIAREYGFDVTMCKDLAGRPRCLVLR